ncbi:hypothetical protein AB0D08_40680, partial [Kitasatospora sp. NPDC048540]|uniref:hypothetical protein n=1 Tax=Kitasatospora sp. NPDC048540 TaxID=3155634 RepID=UPI00340711F3
RAAGKKNSDLRRDGMSLLLRGVAAAIGPRGEAGTGAWPGARKCAAGRRGTARPDVRCGTAF